MNNKYFKCHTFDAWKKDYFLKFFFTGIRLPSDIIRRTKTPNTSLVNSFSVWILYFCQHTYRPHQSRKHCVKSVQIRSYFSSIFSCIRTEYRKIRVRKLLHIWRLFTYWKIFHYHQLFHLINRDKLWNCHNEKGIHNMLRGISVTF